MYNIAFIMPHGGGWHWLSNLIYHLQHNDFTLPNVPAAVFDDEPQSDILFSHAYEWPTKRFIEFPSNVQRILVSTDKPFNLYLNDIKKIHLSPRFLNKVALPETQQFIELSNAAKSWLVDPLLRYYQENIVLNTRLLFCDPDQFLNELFAILDAAGIEYTKNIEYCYTSIANYKLTCFCPGEHVGNIHSIPWLAWCHALSVVHQLPYYNNLNFLTLPTIDHCRDALRPNQSIYLELTESLFFPWP